MNSKTRDEPLSNDNNNINKRIPCIFKNNQGEVKMDINNVKKYSMSNNYKKSY